MIGGGVSASPVAARSLGCGAPLGLLGQLSLGGRHTREADSTGGRREAELQGYVGDTGEAQLWLLDRRRCLGGHGVVLGGAVVREFAAVHAVVLHVGSVAGGCYGVSANIGPSVRPQATKYLAWGWWQMSAEVVCSGWYCQPVSSLTCTPMRPAPSSVATVALSSRSGQAG